MRTVRMASGAVLKVRRCGNQAEHAAHRWRGLNTRHHGYYCEGRGPAGVSPSNTQAAWIGGNR